MEAPQIDKKLSYETLCTILDSIIKEAPFNDKNYYPTTKNEETEHYARSRAIIHLYLKVKFSIDTFLEREYYLTDKGGDGGIDAYYIDNKRKIVYFIQSKLRSNAENYDNKGITYTEMFSMDVSRILSGKEFNANGEKYNDKILKSLLPDYRKIPKVAEYKLQVVLIGSSILTGEDKLKKIIGDYSFEQITTKKIASELIFPLVSGTYYSDSSLEIEIDITLTNETHLDYKVESDLANCQIKLLFVPAIEIGRIISTFKNAILKFNPRNFLELAKNNVNKEIYNSLKEKKGNLFSVLNNGITIVSSDASITDATGIDGKGQALLTNPQLINGGQTAYTLSRIFDECKKINDFSVFNGKEVLLRVIELKNDNAENTELIEEISKASNSQTKIEEADRRSNEEIQVSLQKDFFEKYGLYYERKKGEFTDGLKQGYVNQDRILDREKIVSIALASQYRANQARSSPKKYFMKKEFDILIKLGDIDKYVSGYKILSVLSDLEKEKPKIKGDRYKTKLYGQALRYGKFSVIAVCLNIKFKKDTSIADKVKSVLSKWHDFEKWATSLPTNNGYKLIEGGLDFANYYKGSTLNADLKKFDFN